MKYFKKEILSNRVVLKTPRRIHWEPIGDDEGIISLDDGEIAGELALLASLRRGGVVAITKETYEELKKKVDPTLRIKSGIRDPWRDNSTPRLTALNLENPVAGGFSRNPNTVPGVSPEGKAVTVPANPPKKDPHIKPPLSFAGAGPVDPSSNRPKPTKAGAAKPEPPKPSDLR